VEKKVEKRTEIQKQLSMVLNRAEAIQRIMKPQNTPTEEKGVGLSETEKQVLAASSKINNHLFLPFVRTDLKEQFVFKSTWTDPDGIYACVCLVVLLLFYVHNFLLGFLALSEKQLKHFKYWKRFDSISKGQTPQIIYLGLFSSMNK
jgi:hypothetical protein